ncbi:hypothetical protein K7X08_012449 [Anisodus acutangulus]|uniref:Uncharacterized protein n=1 Tax=Anisodus acutangulus TaxID=402998 RepID=A0A9Q1LD61_9SOLA|nr:hypothetical protein K7X08_012449 [Anisodus acutangulus]
MQNSEDRVNINQISTKGRCNLIRWNKARDQGAIDGHRRFDWANGWFHVRLPEFCWQAHRDVMKTVAHFSLLYEMGDYQAASQELY